MRTALDNSPVLFADVFCARRTACMNRRVARRGVVGRPRSGRPLPDVAGDVVEAVPVWRKSFHRRCLVKAVGPKVLPRESAVPGVGHDATFRHEVPAPGVGSAVQPATGGVLPLGLGRQHFSDPDCVRGCILITDMQRPGADPARQGCCLVRRGDASLFLEPMPTTGSSRQAGWVPSSQRRLESRAPNQPLPHQENRLRRVPARLR